MLYRPLWGIVVDQSGTCIKDATATIIGGARHGEVAMQTPPCSTQDDPDERVGFVVTNLPLGAVVTLRASAPGYVSQDVNVRMVFPQDELVIRLLPVN